MIDHWSKSISSGLWDEIAGDYAAVDFGAPPKSRYCHPLWRS